MSEAAQLLDNLAQLERASRRTLPAVAVGLVLVLVALAWSHRQLTRTQDDIARAEARLATATRGAEDAERHLAKLNVEIMRLQAMVNSLHAQATPAQAPAFARATQQVEDLRVEVQAAQDSLTAANPSSLRPRVYIHIGNESQRAQALQLGQALARDRQLIVPGVEKVRSVPRETELRYFRQADRADADKAAAVLRAQGISPTVKYVPGHEASTRIRPRHLELWLAG